MICPKCNNEIADDSKFCPLCGATIAEAPAEQAQPVTTYEAAPIDTPQPNTLVWGILSLVLSECYLVGAILGIVFGKKAKKLAKLYTEATGKPVTGAAKVGVILGKIGFILGIVMLVVWAIYTVIFALGVIGGIAGSASNIEFNF